MTPTKAGKSPDTAPEPAEKQQESVAEFTRNGMQLIVNAIRCSNMLPTGAARDVYCNHPSYMRVIKQESDQILDIIQNVLRNNDVRGNIARRDDDEKMELLQKCNDNMLEVINSELDEVGGIRKAPEPVLVESQFSLPVDKGQLSGSWNENKNLGKMHESAKLLTAKNIPRPQVNFKVPVDNSNAAFEPRIKYKPHSIKPLAVLAEYDDNGDIESYLHPYEFELLRFEAPSEQLVKVEVKTSPKMEETELAYINTASQLEQLLDDLKDVKELAVDLEHHSYRTFQGITCLMQLSTRSRDYIIDTIELREELHLLNEVFANPKVVKVFHGADSDVEWLQRDLSLYVVNMFDTHQGAQRLSFARLSLAYLLKHYCNVDADKTFQLADWRIRPLPKELIFYARQDTHHLLEIYDRMRNDLLKQNNGAENLLKSVYQASREICKKRYIKQRLYPDSHMNLLRRSKKMFDNRQMFALKELYKWRDGIARLEDESTGYTLPNHMLMQICENIPREMQGVLACCNPVPPLVRQNLHQIHQIMLKAREQPLIKKVIADVINRPTPPTLTTSAISTLYCPHDLTHDQDFRDNLPTLLGDQAAQQSVRLLPAVLRRSKSSLEIFDSDDSGNESDTTVASRVKDIKFITPYSRYLSILPIAEEQERLANIIAVEEAKLRQLCPELKRKPDAIAGVDLPAPKKQKKEKEVVPSFNEMIQKEKDSTSAESPAKPQKTKKSKGKNKKNNHPKDPSHPTTSTPVAHFDYSQVDYSKFQGGSAQQTQNGRGGRGGGRGRGGRDNNSYSSKFKPHGQKARNADKKFNKMFSFTKSTKKN